MQCATSFRRDENRSSEGIDLVDVKAILQRAQYLPQVINIYTSLYIHIHHIHTYIIHTYKNMYIFLELHLVELSAREEVEHGGFMQMRQLTPRMLTGKGRSDEWQVI